MKRRWYRRCGADFIHGTMSLTLEEKGAYSLCLDLVYDRGGPIPDDERWLAGICNVSTRKWRSLRQRLIDLGKLAQIDGCLTNSRAELEIVSLETQARKLAESGAKGGRTRAENAATSNENNDLGQATLKHLREDKIREEKKEEVGADAPSGGFAFRGRTIRLTRKDFDKWRMTYHSIPDLKAELASIDAWLQSVPEQQGRWFHSVQKMLNKKHQEILKPAPENDPVAYRKGPMRV